MTSPVAQHGAPEEELSDRTHDKSSGGRRLWIRKLVVTTTAVTTAWGLGALFDSADAVVAGILVLITLRLSLHASVNEAVGQLLGVFFGAGLAFGLIELAGAARVVAVAAATVVAICAARLLRLGDEGAANIAITSIILLGPGDPGSAAIDRVWGTFLGVVVAVIFSYFMHPSSPVGRTVDAVSALLEDCSTLLARMGRQVVDGYSLDDASVWLHESRLLVSRIPEVRRQAYEAKRYARWYPWASRDMAEAVFTRFIEAEHSAVQVRTIARGLLDSVEKGRRIPRSVRVDLAAALSSAAEALEVQARHVCADPDQPTPTGPAKQVMVHIRELGDELVQLDDPGALVLSASLSAAVERIADSLRGRSAALTEVPHIQSEADTADRLASAVTQPVRQIRSPWPRRVRLRRARAGRNSHND